MNKKYNLSETNPFFHARTPTADTNKHDQRPVEAHTIHLKKK